MERELKCVCVSCCRCWLLSRETGHDVQSAAERCEHPAGLQGGQEEQDYSRYHTASTSRLCTLLIAAFMNDNEPITPLSTVSYITYGPFTSYAPTYDSSFANISKEDSDLIYSFYGEESSLQGSDRYVQHDRRRTRALRHSHKTSHEPFLADCFPHASPFHRRNPVWRRSALTPTHQFSHRGFIFCLSCIIISWYSTRWHSWHP